MPADALQTALVFESVERLSLRPFVPKAKLAVGPDDVKIRMHTVGICGSDVHYYKHGRIGSTFVVKEPFVLGHEGAGTVTEVGANVTTLKVGDRVCMEPGVPHPGDVKSRAVREGIYHMEPGLTFWATPPHDGCLTPYVVHPAAFTYRLPDSMSFAEGALMEPFSVGVHAVTKAKIEPGEIALVLGAGTIGMMCVHAALAGGCGAVIVCDLVEEKLAMIGRVNGVRTVNLRKEKLEDVVHAVTGGWGVNVIFEASGSPKAFENWTQLICPRGLLVLVGMPSAPVPFDVVELQSKEARVESVFRYVNCYPRAIQLVASGRVDIKHMVTRTFPFEQSVKAFEEAAATRASDVKIQIVFEE